MKSCKGTYYVTVIEDTFTHEIIGAATLVVEQKFIRGCAKVRPFYLISLFLDHFIFFVKIFLERNYWRGCGIRSVSRPTIGKAVSAKIRSFILCCGSIGLNWFFYYFRIVATLIEMGKSLGCYKVSLNCTDQMIKFYCSLGFKQEEGNANFLQIRM